MEYFQDPTSPIPHDPLHARPRPTGILYGAATINSCDPVTSNHPSNHQLPNLENADQSDHPRLHFPHLRYTSL